MSLFGNNNAEKSNAQYLDLLLGSKQESAQIVTIALQPQLPYMTVLHSYKVTVKNKSGKNYFGLGSDRNAELAIVKAANEAIGKYSINESGISEKSNGLAVHPSEILASEMALFEMIERDQFLISWLAEYVPYSIDIESLPQKTLRKIFSKIKSASQELHLYSFSHDVPVHVIGVLIVSKSNEICFGLGSSLVFEKSLEKALTEAVRWFAYKAENPNYDDIHLGKEHFMLQSKNVSYSDYLNSRRWGCGMGDLEKFVAAKKVSYTKLDAGPFHNMTHVIKATSPYLQDLFFGQPSQERINNKRLSELGLKWVNQSPHPLH